MYLARTPHKRYLKMVFITISVGTSSPTDVALPMHDVCFLRDLGEQAVLKYIFLSLF